MIEWNGGEEANGEQKRILLSFSESGRCRKIRDLDCFFGGVSVAINSLLRLTLRGADAGVGGAWLV